MIELFNLEVKEAEARFRKSSSFILSPETAFSRIVPTPEVATSPPEYAGAVDQRQIEPPLDDLATKIGCYWLYTLNV